MSKSFVYEFGGPIGNLSIIISSHIILFYMYWCLGVKTWMPSLFTITTYTAFIIVEGVLAMIMPGVWIKGLALKNQKTSREYSLDYLCNGLSSWYMTLILLFCSHYFGYFKIFWITDNIGSYLTTSVIFANLFSLIIYLWGVKVDTSHEHIKEYKFQMYTLRRKIAGFRGLNSEYEKLIEEYNIISEKHEKIVNEGLSGNVIYDFFMGSILNPRICILDLKMFAEIRISWILLFLITTANALKQLEEYGEISNSMMLIWIAQTLYTNACMKGEECIPTTWDIFHEKFGWMLIWWNLSGVPFLYAINSYYIYTNKISLSLLQFLVLLFFLNVAYWIWDTANSQKNRFRMKQRGTFLERPWAFPQFSNGTINNPSFITTKCGSKLLIDGWWIVARKIHYTADLTMALIWGLSCGFSSFIPYFYFFFFLTHLLHRAKRDNERCSKKYGKDWDKYCKLVPYTFIPYIY